MRGSLSRLNTHVFIPVFAFFTLLFVLIAIFPENAATIAEGIMQFTLTNFGWVYVLCYALFLVAYVVIGIRYGNVKLGDPDDKPEYSFFSWMGLLFGAGLGVGLVFFGVAEPANHFITPMFAESGTADAASDAMRQTFFHWSLIPWSGYGIAGLAIAFFAHRCKRPALISSALEPLFGKRAEGSLGKAVNVFAALAMVCGISMSVGYASTQLLAGLSIQYHVGNTPLMIVVAVVGFTIVAIVSCFDKQAKGIKLVSDINLWLVLILMGFAFVCGPTLYIIGTLFQSTGDMIAKFPEMMFFLDVNHKVADHVGFDWVSTWTVFYWAWWCAFVPFVGGFLADISRGRTVREFVFASLLVPGAICCVWFACYGGGAIEHTLFLGSDVTAIAAANQEVSLFAYLNELPIPELTIPAAMVLICTLIITSMNSATQVIGRYSIVEGGEPSPCTRVIWLVIVAVFAVSFIFLGGLPILRNTAVVFALPFVVIMVLMVVGLIRGLQQDSAEH